jgi:hypothetical protein
MLPCSRCSKVIPMNEWCDCPEAVKARREYEAEIEKYSQWWWRDPPYKWRPKYRSSTTEEEIA